VRPAQPRARASTQYERGNGSRFPAEIQTPYTIQVARFRKMVEAAER